LDQEKINNEDETPSLPALERLDNNRPGYGAFAYP
jgi:hypothetical protein